MWMRQVNEYYDLKFAELKVENDKQYKVKTI